MVVAARICEIWPPQFLMYCIIGNCGLYHPAHLTKDLENLFAHLLQVHAYPATFVEYREKCDRAAALLVCRHPVPHSSLIRIDSDASMVRNIRQFLPLATEAAVSDVSAVGLHGVVIPTTWIRQHPGVYLEFGLLGLRRAPGLVQECSGANN